MLSTISTLKLNQATISLQHGESGDDILSSLNELVVGTEVPTRLIRSVRQLVFDYDIGLADLVTWYQTNDPLSPWHTLARAALFAQEKDELNAAREYRRVAENSEFDLRELNDSLPKIHHSSCSCRTMERGCETYWTTNPH